MEGRRHERRLFDWLWLLVWGLASSAWCLTAAEQLGATFDEATDLARDMEWWRHGTHHSLLKVGAMPLPMDLATLPLYVWERWHGTEIDPLTDLHGLLPWARAGTLVFWWILLWYGRLAGRRLAGPWGGRLAVALLACEPCLLAHACLATKDVAVSACVLALVYHFRTGREAAWFRRVGVPGFWFGASLLAKASGMVFGPLCMLMVELEYLFHSRTASPEENQPTNPLGWARLLYQRLQPFRRDSFQIGLLGLVLTFLYCGSDFQTEPSFITWAHHLPDGALGRSMVWLSEHLCLFSNAGEGLIKQVTHNARGHGVYLLGQSAPRAFWYYFPVVLTMKLSLPLLILPCLLILVRARALTNWACWATAGLLLFTPLCRVQTGIRLILPLVVLGIVGLAAAAVRAWMDSRPGWGRRLLSAALVGSVAWTVTAAAGVWPEGLCYTNELWGGTEAGYRCLSDSNYDWGQGLKDLATWEKQRGLSNVEVWYFGTDPALRALPMRPFPLESLPIQQPADVLSAVRGHILAASTTHLYGAYDVNPAHQIAAAFLRGCRPVARTQTFFIYDFTHPESLQAPLAGQ